MIGIFNYSLFKYSLIANLADDLNDETIKIRIKLSQKYKNRMFNEMNMESEFIDYLRKIFIDSEYELFSKNNK